MSILRKRRVLAIKIESVAGTAETLSATDCIFVFDPVMQADIPPQQRAATGTLSALASIPGARKGTLTFSVEAAGSGTGTDPKWASVLLLACGMVAASHVYTFTSDTANYKTATCGLYENGRIKLMTGAMGTWALDANSGQAGMIKFTMTGVWQAPTDGSMLALPSYAVVAPRFASSTFTIGSHTPKISKFSLESGNTIKLAEDITQASGYSRAVVTDRAVKGKFDPEADLIANYDVYGDWIAGAERAFSLAIGSATGNTLTWAGSRLQIVNGQEGDRDSLVTDELDFQLNGTSAGDNEFSLTFS